MTGIRAWIQDCHTAGSYKGNHSQRGTMIFESVLNSQVNVLVGLDMSIPRGAIYGLVSQPFANTRVPLGYSWRHYLPDKGP